MSNIITNISGGLNELGVEDLCRVFKQKITSVVRIKSARENTKLEEHVNILITRGSRKRKLKTTKNDVRTGFWVTTCVEK